MDLPNRVANPTNLMGGEENSANEQKLEHSGKIPYFTFQVSVKANTDLPLLEIMIWDSCFRNFDHGAGFLRNEFRSADTSFTKYLISANDVFN